MTLLLLSIAIACLLGATLIFRRKIGFAAQQPADYSEGPTFDLRRHLNGPMVCEGILYGPLGRVSARFVADFEAEWDGNIGRMTERFHYQGGTTQDREWQLTTHNDGRIDARAEDLEGVGQGQQLGSAVRLQYRLRLPESAGSHVLDVTDWMYLLDNGTIVNRSQMRKFGLKVAELVATIRAA